MEINADDLWLLISITDNGIGRQKAEELKSGKTDYPRSMGMEITNNRLKVVNDQHPYSLDIHDIKDVDGIAAGTQVWVRIKRQTSLQSLPGHTTV